MDLGGAKARNAAAGVHDMCVGSLAVSVLDRRTGPPCVAGAE